jgi:hypothetical protein
MTVDVTPGGIVMTSDSQPVDIYPDRFAMPADRALFENHLIPATLHGFSGFAAYVGTINICNRSTRNWLARELAVRTGSSLEITCRELADELTSLWSAQRLETRTCRSSSPATRTAKRASGTCATGDSHPASFSFHAPSRR